ncbi:MAG: hypothetical protein ACE5GL_08370, partial [Calditrichia bacterium]
YLRPEQLRDRLQSCLSKNMQEEFFLATQDIMSHRLSFLGFSKKYFGGAMPQFLGLAELNPARK